MKRLASAVALLGLATLGVVAVPHDANAWWRGGWCCGVGIYVAPPAYYPPPAYYAPPPAYYPPPGRYWVPAHWEGGYWVPGHWN